jgi:hypothetical protein
MTPQEASEWHWSGSGYWIGHAVGWPNISWTIYLAAPFEELRRLRAIKAQIEAATPHRVGSAWLAEDPDTPVTPDPIMWPTMARRDLLDIDRAHL